VAQWQDLHGNADLDAIGAGGDGTGDAERRRQQRTLRVEMELGQPHHIEAPALGRIDLSKGFPEGFPLASPRQGRKLVEHAEFHGADLLLHAAARGLG